MPCRDDGDGYDDYVYRREKENQRRLDLLTREMCSLLAERPELADHSQELRAWWENHKVEDAARIKREEERRQRDEEERLRRIAELEREVERLKKG